MKNKNLMLFKTEMNILKSKINIFKSIVNKNFIFVLTIFLLSAFGSESLFANNYDTKVILKAMKDEMNRNMKELKLENLDKPYYIEYSIRIDFRHQATATLGEIISNDAEVTPYLNVGVRVGNYDLDNSNFFDVGFSFFGSTDDEENYTSRKLPIDLNYDNLRNEIWLATDAAYKQSSEIYAKKLAALKNIIRKDTIPDFSKINPKHLYDTSAFPKFDFKKFTELTSRISSIFRDYKKISASRVNFEYIPSRYYYVNSEGVEYVKDDFTTGFEVVAYSQSENGNPIAEHFTAYSKNPNSLPNEDSLAKATQYIANLLTMETKAPSLDESYNGPVLLEQQAAAEAVAQVFAPNLVAQRQQLSEGFSIGGNNKTLAFQKKIGGRVLPDFISVFDSPDQAKYKGTELFGSYSVDDDGLQPERLTLVENGYLKTLLTERIPIKRVYQSNARKRGGSAMFSNLFIFSDPMKTLKEDDLKKKMIDLLKQRDLPFGIIVRKILNQNIQSTGLINVSYGQSTYFSDANSLTTLEAFKVYQNGREELIRDIVINSLTPQSFKDIIFAGKDSYAYNFLAPSVISSFMTGGMAYIDASIVTPSLLFEDMEINPIEKDSPKPPYIANPVSKK